jgi:hypothetical protein
MKDSLDINSDLEDGEIREELPLEDISDCSISEIVTMKKGNGRRGIVLDLHGAIHEVVWCRYVSFSASRFSIPLYCTRLIIFSDIENEEELDIDLLREEALKSMYNAEEENEEEIEIEEKN